MQKTNKRNEIRFRATEVAATVINIYSPVSTISLFKACATQPRYNTQLRAPNVNYINTCDPLTAKLMKNRKHRTREAYIMSACTQS